MTLKDKIENLKDLLDEEIDHATKARLAVSLIKLTTSSTSPSLKRQKRGDSKISSLSKQQPVIFVDALSNYLGLEDDDQNE